MQSRDEVILSLRPMLTLESGTTIEERFQNEVLRPILKFQNELIIDLAKQYVQKQVKNFNALKSSAQETVLRNAGKNDPELRNPLIFSVISLFTSDEMVTYQKYRAEIHRRIATMAVQRIISQIDRLY